MTIQKFSISEAIRFGWETTMKNLGFFIGLLAASWAFFIALFFAMRMALEVNIFLGVILHIFYYVSTIVISMGLVKIALKFYDNEKGKFSDLFSQYRLFFNYLFALILYALIIWGGTLLLIIPGIIWGIKVWFFDYLVVDKKLGPIKALKKSSAITKGFKWDLLGFFFVAFVINLLGVLFLLIGLFVTIPVTMMATVFVYRKLLAQAEATPEI